VAVDVAVDVVVVGEVVVVVDRVLLFEEDCWDCWRKRFLKFGKNDVCDVCGDLEERSGGSYCVKLGVECDA